MIGRVVLLAGLVPDDVFGEELGDAAPVAAGAGLVERPECLLFRIHGADPKTSGSRRRVAGAMAMCSVCRRNMLVGEGYRLFREGARAAERPVCRLCEEEAEQQGWVRLERPLELEKGVVVWHARKVA
jgi:hypothetical protein